MRLKAFLEEVLFPWIDAQSVANRVLVMDNARFHKIGAIMALSIIPPYSLGAALYVPVFTTVGRG